MKITWEQKLSYLKSMYLELCKYGYYETINPKDADIIQAVIMDVAALRDIGVLKRCGYIEEVPK